MKYENSLLVLEKKFPHTTGLPLCGGQEFLKLETQLMSVEYTPSKTDLPMRLATNFNVKTQFMSLGTESVQNWPALAR